MDKSLEFDISSELDRQSQIDKQSDVDKELEVDKRQNWIIESESEVDWLSIPGPGMLSEIWRCNAQFSIIRYVST